jgi:hypothetical protein
METTSFRLDKLDGLPNDQTLPPSHPIRIKQKIFVSNGRNIHGIKKKRGEKAPPLNQQTKSCTKLSTRPLPVDEPSPHSERLLHSLYGIRENKGRVAITLFMIYIIAIHPMAVRFI